MDLLEQHHQRTQALPLERQGLVQALVALLPLVHNVLLNPHILLVVGKSSGKGSKGSKGEKGGKSSKGKEKGGKSSRGHGKTLTR